ncbi:hypothetical protein OV203_39850 [Nannocystis sp. ILAH1]|uniref:hypothetical protein n=1 Tax=unclassified Nannocystis TaxID=2627009 RepID=UPI002270C5FD|nr:MULTISPECIES: hypothetical protein [unclassified Nannocystis]MCY0993359.1 hypothetical protein [Nannocystis sp. ILAH1]MCY1063208.1 hypothetical protein [Nannocystis sp. RBIL2]
MDLSLPLRLESLQQALVRRACAWVVGLASTVMIAFVALRPRPACGCMTKEQIAATENLWLMAAAEQFERQHGRCPRDHAEVRIAGLAPKVAADPWGRRYELSCTPGALRVCSRGADGVRPGDDVCGGAVRLPALAVRSTADDMVP